MIADSATPPDGGADTIAAVSTAAGAGAIGIVRLSGPEAGDIGRRVFRPVGSSTGRESHRLRYGHVVDPETKQVVDEVLFAFMQAPATYTREDVVEIHCHGGPAAQRAVLGLLLRHGARPADPGEFTRRAFLNGRIDLTQAESVGAIVRARTGVALKAAVRQLEGGLGDRLRDVRAHVVGALAQVEATIDFSDEDVDDIDRGLVADGLETACHTLETLLETAFLGRALDEGVRTAIVGRPNVGKSSLLNSLVMRERAIVSEIPGTTRDTIEELIEVGGIPLRLIDTAGMREGLDEIEALGIERSRRAIEDADLTLAVLDAAAGFQQEDEALLRLMPRERTIVLLNKVDVAGRSDLEHMAGGAMLLMDSAAGDGDGARPIPVSAITGEGLDVLRDRISSYLLGDGSFFLEEPLLATERQRRLVEDSVEYVRRAQQSISDGAPDELVAEDIRHAVESIGAITGEQVVPDLIDEIFSRFCIGK